MAKVCFMMNRYQEAADLNQEVIEAAKTSSDNKKVLVYQWKAMANLATVKCMAANFKEAQKLCDQVNTSAMSFTDRVKHGIKHASVLKKSSCYREGLKMLESLEAKLNEQLEQSDENSKLFKYLHKVLRDKARLYFLCKDRRAEKKMEEDS